MELGNLIFGHCSGGYKIPKDWQDTFDTFLEDIGCDAYGHLKDYTCSNKLGGITTDMFEVNPYYWGEDEKMLNTPNFVFRPTGYEIRWYKYPLRDSYSNFPISFDIFQAMINACTKFYRGQKNE